MTNRATKQVKVGMRLRDALALSREIGCEVTEEGTNFHIHHPEYPEAGYAKTRRKDSDVQIGFVNYLKRLERAQKSNGELFNGAKAGVLASMKDRKLPEPKPVKPPKLVKPKHHGPKIPAMLEQILAGAKEWDYQCHEGALIKIRVLVNPELAMTWLNRMGPNRDISQRTVDKYGRDMKEGRWYDIGDPIRFDIAGFLRDGQHRLWAVVEANVSEYFTIAFGVTEQGVAAIDTGRGRSYANVHTMRGTTNVATFAALCRILWTAELHDDRPVDNYAESPSHGELDEIAGRYAKEIDCALSFVMSEASHVVPSRTVLAFAFLKFSQINKADAEKWLKDLLTGESLEAKDPVYKLRRFFEKNRAGPRGGGRNRMNRSLMYAMMVKSWNYRRDGVTPGILIFRSDEIFPKPH